MTHEPDVDDLAPEEAAAYRALSDEGPLPAPRLESRVTEALRARGLLVNPRRTHTWLGLLAAGLVLLAAGVLVGRGWPAPTARPAGARFVLFLEDSTGQEQGADEANRVREYSAWAREQSAAGHLVGGEKLELTAFTLVGDAEPAVAADRLPVVGGYFVVVADDLAGAVAVARTCPHLRHGGRIVIRPIATL